MKNAQIVSIVGKSGSGKTTLLEKLIFELKQRGYKIGSVKHAHDGFEVDKKGKDSWRHRKAGADATLVVSKTKTALIRDEDLNLIEKMQKYLSDTDLIIAEGFKKQSLPKIEVFRLASNHKSPLCMADDKLIGFVTDSDYQPDVPIFGLEDFKEIATLIEDTFLS
ncbi:MAG: molybdopterin-guanine dinucleotide biosynthesis protein B [Desulfobacteraceae bacterium]|nr:molybdopterin-guanine dinucleotide biosynthesis protein B [Desulfobacteraceae bacterium]